MTIASSPSRIFYPDSDGQPMADNTLQFRWIVTIKENLDRMFASDPNVFVAGDLLWYPVEGEPGIRRAPDAMVVFGRPKGDRGFYRQWQEANIPPQVVFEILSPGNTIREMAQKLAFYDHYGVSEYYLYDPDKVDLGIWQRQSDHLSAIQEVQGWVSPLLGIRFELQPETLIIFRPDDRPFLTFQELAEQAERSRLDAQQSKLDAQQLKQEAESAQTRAIEAEAKAARLADQLRALGVDPNF